MNSSTLPFFRNSRLRPFVRGLSTGLLVGGGLLVASGCGSPGKLDDDLFPAEYRDDSGSVGEAGSPPASIPGNSVGGAGGMMNGAAGGVNAPQAGSAGTGNMLPDDGVPDSNVPGCDAPSLFKRPVTEGGCTSGAGGGCHEGGDESVSPDLVSDGVAARLLGATSMATSCEGLTIVGNTAESSYLLDKIAFEASPQCGFPMPFLNESSLSEVDRQCIVDWVTAIAGGQ